MERGSRAAASEIEQARASCRRARAAFAELFGEPVPSVRVVIWDRSRYRTGTEGDAAVVFWPTGGVVTNGGRDPAALPHEIAHVLLAARFYAEADEAWRGYGTPLPDWLEEGVAIWAEPRERREARLAAARRLPAERLDLESILAGAHPAARDPALLRIRDGNAPPDHETLWDFYPQSVAVLAFVYDAGGSSAVRTLTERLRADPADRRALRGLRGLPLNEAGVLRSWKAWLEATPAPR